MFAINKMKKTSRKHNYPKKRLKKMKLAFKSKFEVATLQSLSSSDFSDREVEIVEQLKKYSQK